MCFGWLLVWLICLPVIWILLLSITIGPGLWSPTLSSCCTCGAATLPWNQRSKVTKALPLLDIHDITHPSETLHTDTLLYYTDTLLKLYWYSIDTLLIPHWWYQYYIDTLLIDIDYWYPTYWNSTDTLHTDMLLILYLNSQPVGAEVGRGMPFNWKKVSKNNWLFYLYKSGVNMELTWMPWPGRMHSLCCSSRLLTPAGSQVTGVRGLVLY